MCLLVSTGYTVRRMLLNCFSRLRTRIVWHRLFSTARTADVQVDNLVIGAGIVGLAVAEKLTRERPTEATIVIDKNKRCGEETRYLLYLFDGLERQTWS